MPDRTIPFYNTILRCDGYTARDITVPEGFGIRPYQPGDEHDWARMERTIGDFDTVQQAERYFTQTYLRDADKRDRILFAVNAEGSVVGSCIAWQDPRQGGQAASLHWLVVDAAYRNRGLGRALCGSVMKQFADKGEMPVYIHTQPWSWKAILLYLSMGFRLQRQDSFAGYINEYDKAMETLREVVSAEQFAKMQQHSQY